MGWETRKRSPLPSSGPFLAEITNHLDPTFMGRLEVALLKGVPNSIIHQADTYIVKYLSPFYGVMSVRFEGTDESNFQHVQKSYGMWMVPPDIGTQVLCIFIDGDPNQGYWMGCVQDNFQNHMVPGIAASKQTAMSEDQKRKYGTELLPVAEFNKKSKKLDNPNVETFQKPVHPFADRLLQQGLLLDTVRGVTSSSARREHPSSVFGISTPGPLDQSEGAQQGTLGYAGDEIRQVPVTRLGGTSFVMDDGDINGQNELVRIRTRTGHQILLHNSHDLIYIANSKGTAWIEMTSRGKIDVYAQDSISIHSEGDFNFLADRDINFEAGRNLNIAVNGNMSTEVTAGHNIIVNGTSKQSYGGAYNIVAGSDINMQSSGVYNLSSGREMRMTAGGQLSVGASGNIIVAGSKVDINGPAPTTASSPDTPSTLARFELPYRSAASSSWENGKFYKAGNITSIMLRVPTHEPWDHHENTDPTRFTTNNTSVQTSPNPSPTVNPTNEGIDNSTNTTPIAPPTSGKAGDLEKYLESALIAGGIKEKTKLAAWMAQCKIESARFTTLKEFGNDAYFARYENSSGLGNDQPGDGLKYKGRGFLQCTGKKLYKAISDYYKGAIDLVANPELLEQPEWGAKGVFFYFNKFKPRNFQNPTMEKLGVKYVDTVEFWGNCPAVTALVQGSNGKDSHLPERQAAFDYYMKKYENGIPNVGSTTASTSTGSVVVVGDSIAVGVGEALQKLIQGIKVSALKGAGSPKILTDYVPAVVGAGIAVVSAGSNDIGIKFPTSQTPANQQLLLSNLKKIRIALNAKRYIWLVPHYEIPAKIVTDFASANGDQTVTFEASTREDPPLHPVNPAVVAQAVKRLIGQ